ncbi:MAG: class I SAM-dependent methyltransferase [Gemmatimonadota bacterium]
MTTTGAELQLPPTERVACDLCGADDASELYRSGDYRFEVDDAEWSVVQCRRCALAYLNPRPTAEAISRYYPPTYFQDRDAPALRRRYDLQTAFLSKLPVGRLLDIGCANGDWMRLMVMHGWRVTGLEPSPDSSNSHGLDIRHGRFPESNTDVGGPYDVVTAWAVFEHLHQPHAAFRQAASLLAPGGRLIILVTNINSVFSRWSRQEDIPRHLYFFSEGTLRRYAESVGLSLDAVHHETGLFGGAGRGTLRRLSFQAVGVSTREYFRFMARASSERWTASPGLALLGGGFGLVERLILSDTMTRLLRVNGHIVAEFRKP